MFWSNPYVIRPKKLLAEKHHYQDCVAQGDRYGQGSQDFMNGQEPTFELSAKQTGRSGNQKQRQGGYT
jgi:hypothetical protein